MSEKFADSGSASGLYKWRDYRELNINVFKGLAWHIIVTIVFLAATGFHIFRYVKQRNKFHLALAFAAFLQAFVAGVLIGRIYIPVVGSVSFWIIIAVPAYLLGTWARSMSKHIGQRQSSTIFITSVFWMVAFGVGVILFTVYTSFVLFGGSQYSITMFRYARSGYIEVIVGQVVLLLICLWQSVKTAGGSSALAFKRKQLFRLAVIYALTISASVCDFVGTLDAAYASGVMLMLYFVATLVPAEASTDYHKPPSDDVAETDVVTSAEYV
ncbi:hypothetical protein THASP1DRAFT_29449 [Thamnocephalis sphaerospora]|uniref:Uncharacterized protein n=1 Tax=Thamnocephalis sphaerospora TaxID=78915 RepID=A0A4P9XS28_9FUNG|nr:hypothetical protein THASP1DRAFT_29449 [Thamnocephalis sphaerospora]|eukprot:RKP08762.1 hypothetical protein THASP1DRAFT_29449 [Thamnocephalis sphaerospora]